MFFLYVTLFSLFSRLHNKKYLLLNLWFCVCDFSFTPELYQRYILFFSIYYRASLRCPSIYSLIIYSSFTQMCVFDFFLCSACQVQAKIVQGYWPRSVAYRVSVMYVISVRFLPYRSDNCLSFRLMNPRCVGFRLVWR